MPKKKVMKMEAKAKKVDDFSANDKGQSIAQNLQESNPKLSKFVGKKVKSR